MKKKSVNLQGQKLHLNKIRIAGLSPESTKYVGGGTGPIIYKPPVPIPPAPKPQEPKPTGTVGTVSRDSLAGGHECTVVGGGGNN